MVDISDIKMKDIIKLKNEDEVNENSLWENYEPEWEIDNPKFY